MHQDSLPSPTPERHPGPPLVLPAGVFTALFLAGLATTALLGGGAYPSPFSTPEGVQAYFSTHREAVRAAAFFQFAAAVPLALFTAVSVSRLRFLGVTAAGATIALAGGLLSAAFLALCGLLGWVLSRPEVLGEPALVRALHDLVFVSGGVAHVVFLGLLVAGISVSSGFRRLLPRWVVVLGLAIAVLAELSTFSLLVEPAAFLLPLARFPAFVWIVATGLLLPATRQGRGTGATA